VNILKIYYYNSAGFVEISEDPLLTKVKRCTARGLAATGSVVAGLGCNTCSLSTFVGVGYCIVAWLLHEPERELSLRQMGANIELFNSAQVGDEPVADIRVRYAPLKGISIPEDQVPLAIDEFPVLFIAAACAEGKTILTGAEELRVKESDRIQSMADGLVTLGVDAVATDDGIHIQGGEIGSGEVESFDDHRIAMAFSIAALRASGPIIVKEANNVATSFPNFISLARQVGINIKIA
jgi:5-enolpyruvylshikimate-3-phosphate synthase